MCPNRLIGRTVIGIHGRQTYVRIRTTGNLVNGEAEAIDIGMAHAEPIVRASAAVREIREVSEIDSKARVRVLLIDKLTVYARVVRVTVNRTRIDRRKQQLQRNAGF